MMLLLFYRLKQKRYMVKLQSMGVKIANPKFDINKVMDAFYKHIKDEEYSKKIN
ncbi:MAG: hypothetical protein IPO37_02830 [Saprospiraceae bacterium]|nr:hypothetical protein [Saprospiraceae bacterium]